MERRRPYSAEERRELWARWKSGESVSEIGRALGRERSTIHRTIREYGGVAPPERRRGRLALKLSEREEISRGVAAGQSARWIAARIGRSASTVHARAESARRPRALPALPMRTDARGSVVGGLSGASSRANLSLRAWSRRSCERSGRRNRSWAG